MNIRAQVKAHIDRLVQQGGGTQHTHFEIGLPGGQLQVQLAEVQPLGCALWQLDVRTPQTAQASTERLHAAGAQLAQRVQYLLEPLQVHEVDAQQAAVQLRSTPPQRDARTVWYYEVTAQRDGGWRLMRYEKSPGQPRQQVAAMVTVEVLQRLCQDVVDVATR